MEWIILVVLVVLIGVLVLAQNNKPSIDSLPYQKKAYLFSPAERSFYGVLRQAAGDTAVVFGKVRVSDVVMPREGLARSDWQSAFNRISSKHFDFVLCNPDDLSVIAAIELDDASHNSRKRIERDNFLEGACNATGLKLHRFKAKKAYQLSNIREILFSDPEQEVVQAVDIPGNEDIPILCPKCSSKLVRRIAKKGANAGISFLGCSSFPKCRYSIKE